MSHMQHKYDHIRNRVQLALVQRIVGNFDDEYKVIVYGDGHKGALFNETHEECINKIKKGEWVSNGTIYKIMYMPAECICLLCHIMGSSLIIPFCVILTRFMRAPSADSRHASLFVNIMDGSTIRINHDHCIMSNFGDMTLLPCGNYTAATLIAIIAGVMWRENIDERAFREFASATTEYETIYHIRALTRERIMSHEQA